MAKLHKIATLENWRTLNEKNNIGSKASSAPESMHSKSYITFQ